MAGPAISRREAEVLALVGESLTNAEIATRLVLSERTVESHVSSLLRKLDASTRRDLARLVGRPPGDLARQPGAPRLPASLDAVVDPDTFVGRRDILAVLAEQWRLATKDRTLGVLLSGDAGIGKTRSVSEFAASVVAAGGRVLSGACYPDDDTPSAPFVQAISTDAETMTDDGLRARGRSREVLGLVAPSLTRALRLERSARRRLPDREAVLDAIVEWISSTAATGPVLLVLEDLHWSTSSTRDAIRQLLRSPVSVPLLVVMTSRVAAGDLPPGFDAFLADLRRLPTFVERTLGGLDVEEVGALTGLGPDEAAALHAQTGGNPLLTSCLASPSGAGAAGLDGYLGDRDARMDAPTRTALDAAAVIGAEFDVELLGRVLEVDPPTLLSSMESAVGLGILRSPKDSAAHFAFTHSMIRDHRYRSLPMRRRLELHAAVAAALEDRDDALAERSRHLCLAVPVAPAATAALSALRAGEAAEAIYAFEEAQTHFRRGCSIVGALEPVEASLGRELAVGLATARRRSGDPSASADLVELAADARRVGDTTVLVRAAMSLPMFGAPLLPAAPDPLVADVVDAALAALEPGPSEARARLELFRVQVRTFWESGDHQTLVDAGARYEAMARGLDDPDGLADVLLHAIHFFSHPSRLADFERIAVELEELGQARDRLVVRLIGVRAQAAAKRCRGDLDGWRAEKNRYAAILGARPVPWLQLSAASARAHAAFFDGDLGAAEARARELAPLAIAVGHGPTAWAGGVLMAVWRARGQDDRLVRSLALPDAAEPELSARRCFLAAALARSGNVEEARRVIDHLAHQRFSVPEDYAWTIALGELAEAAEVLGISEPAEHVRAALGPYRGFLGNIGSAVGRPFDESLAQAALAVGDLDTAEEIAADEVEWARAAGTPVFLARGLVFLAVARRRSGSSRRAVAALVDEASMLARRYGATVAAVDLDRFELT